jgi:hypothetical protein
MVDNFFSCQIFKLTKFFIKFWFLFYFLFFFARWMTHELIKSHSSNIAHLTQRTLYLYFIIVKLWIITQENITILRIYQVVKCCWDNTQVANRNHNTQAVMCRVYLERRDTPLMMCVKRHSLRWSLQKIKTILSWRVRKLPHLMSRRKIQIFSIIFMVEIDNSVLSTRQSTQSYQ